MLRRIAVGVACLVCSGAAPVRCGWGQWGRDGAHDGQTCVVAQDAAREQAHVTIDPFVPQEQAETFGSLLTHYQVPLSDGAGNVFVLAKTGTYVSCDPPGSGQPFPCGTAAWPSQVWTERALHWRRGQLAEKWTFLSDWKPAPVPSGWEPMFQPALAGLFIYVPGAGGTVWQVSRRTGVARRRINPFGDSVDPSIYVSGGITADARGNVYYNALKLDPANPWGADARGWLVKVTPAGGVQTVDYATLIPGAPAAADLCYATFAFSVPRPPLPWPPPPQADGSPTLPRTFACLSQRPGVNVTPAIGSDGTVFTVSRAHSGIGANYAYMVALRPDLTLAWAASLRGRLQDGCGVLVPYGSGASNCRGGATPGVDPNTNLPPAGNVTDASSSSPTALPDGGVLYGAYTGYNGARGHTMKFDASGQFAGAFDFGWDSTPAVHAHDGTYSIVLKDNHYATAGPFFITQLGAVLGVEWQFRSTNTETCTRLPDGSLHCVDDGTHPNGFEWCINAPAIDSEGTVYATSEDGNFYAIAQGGVLKSRLFLSAAEGAAYTPLAIDVHGRLYVMNDGEMSVLGR